MTILIDHANPPVFIPRSNEPVVLEVDATGNDATDATQINAPGSLTVVYVASDDGGKGVKLPSGEIGDLIYIFGRAGQSSFHVYKPDGTDMGRGQVMWRLGPDGWADFS